ncbi:nuA3 HAT complex component nto1 [Physocladia obscura]|uniref:NuA3 HAT complex component nto1 n=1 Tax=Physocladia obscura TaxID=109957 RepID=A0AAD5TEJ6_9FUNG|nr:nuA3 HAT complex component nto1 [Physocladia obscura]
MTRKQTTRRRSLRTQTGLANFLAQDRLFGQNLEAALGSHDNNDSDDDSLSQSGEDQHSHSSNNNNTRSQSHSDADSDSNLHSEEEKDNSEHESASSRHTRTHSVEEETETRPQSRSTTPLPPTTPERRESAPGSKRGKRGKGKWKGIGMPRARSKAARRRQRNKTRNNSDHEAGGRESEFFGAGDPGGSGFDSLGFTGVRRLARRHNDIPPLEERTFDSLAPGLKPDAQLRLLRLPLLPSSPPADPPDSGPEQTPPEQLKQMQIQLQTLPESVHSSSLSSLLRSGLDVLMSAISSSAATAPSTAPGNSPTASPQTRKRKSPSPYREALEKNITPPPISSLENMFENDPPSEFKSSSSLPPFNNIHFSKPIPVPRFELISAGHEKIGGNNIATNSLKKKVSFTPGFGNGNGSDDGGDGDDEEEEEEEEKKEEVVNGRPVGTKFLFKENQYIRYIEPTEEDLSRRIEYDMDEQDKIWLEAQNAHRFASTNDPPIPPILFEFIMDRLEKEYFSLLKRVPKPHIQHHHKATTATSPADNSDDNVCAVCDDGECENSNAIVFCDGCNLAVHQDCYGIPYIPEGQWLCRRCMLTPETPISCVLCPALPNTGALKQTNNGGSSKWAHIVCAQWIPEAGFANSTYMEPIDLRSVPNSRFKLTCYISYHVTCAKRCKIFMKISGSVSGGDVENEDMKSCCDKHSPKEYKELVDVEKEIQQFRRSNNSAQSSDMETEETSSHNHDIRSSTSSSRRRQSFSPSRKRPRISSSFTSNNYTTTSSRKRDTNHHQPIETSDEDEDDNSGLKEAQQRQRQRDDQYKKLVATPVIPLGIYRTVCNSIRGGSSSMRGKNAFVEKCCKYWALKRESRRGAPLLKRLYLEPWTATISETQQDETIKYKRMEFLRKLRNDLEKVRMLAELVKKRERERLRRSNLQYQIFNIHLNPVTLLLRPILDQLRKLDAKGLFEDPVDLEDVPDYLSVVGRAMCFEDMHGKLERHEYRSVESFKDDFFLICRNAKLYNSPDTPWYRAADRLLTRSESILTEAFEQESLLAIDKTTGCLASEIPASLFKITTTTATAGELPPAPAIFSPKTSLLKNLPSSQAHHDQSLSSPTTEKQQQLLKDERLAKELHEQELSKSPRTARRRIATAGLSAVAAEKESYNDSKNTSGVIVVRKHRRASTKPTTSNDLNLEQLIADATAENNKNLKREGVSLPLLYASVYLVQDLEKGVVGSSSGSGSGGGGNQKKRRRSLRTAGVENVVGLLKARIVAGGFEMLFLFEDVSKIQKYENKIFISNDELSSEDSKLTASRVE